MPWRRRKAHSSNSSRSRHRLRHREVLNRASPMRDAAEFPAQAFRRQRCNRIAGIDKTGADADANPLSWRPSGGLTRTFSCWRQRYGANEVRVLFIKKPFPSVVSHELRVSAIQRCSSGREPKRPARKSANSAMRRPFIRAPSTGVVTKAAPRRLRFMHVNASARVGGMAVFATPAGSMMRPARVRATSPNTRSISKQAFCSSNIAPANDIARPARIK